MYKLSKLKLGDHLVIASNKKFETLLKKLGVACKSADLSGSAFYIEVANERDAKKAKDIVNKIPTYKVTHIENDPDLGWVVSGIIK